MDIILVSLNFYGKIKDAINPVQFFFTHRKWTREVKVYSITLIPKAKSPPITFQI